jgi:hypothetical protein
MRSPGTRRRRARRGSFGSRWRAPPPCTLRSFSELADPRRATWATPAEARGPSMWSSSTRRICARGPPRSTRRRLHRRPSALSRSPLCPPRNRLSPMRRVPPSPLRRSNGPPYPLERNAAPRRGGRVLRRPRSTQTKPRQKQSATKPAQKPPTKQAQAGPARPVGAFDLTMRRRRRGGSSSATRPPGITIGRERAGSAATSSAP